jgi:hypothetical protein
MSVKSSKQFGVWMDSHHATVLGRKNVTDGGFVVLGHIKNDEPVSNSSEKSSHHLETTLMHKFFKQITALMQNVDEVYVTGTGDAQEQFIKYLSETPQYKHAKATIGTSNKMPDEKLAEEMAGYFDDAIAR